GGRDSGNIEIIGLADDQLLCRLWIIDHELGHAGWSGFLESPILLAKFGIVLAAEYSLRAAPGLSEDVLQARLVWDRHCWFLCGSGVLTHLRRRHRAPRAAAAAAADAPVAPHIPWNRWHRPSLARAAAWA